MIDRPTLNDGQYTALLEILEALPKKEHHLLTGYAGSGKTTLMQEVAREIRENKYTVVLTAPTHKAVSVLAQKIRASGLSDVSVQTIHSLLSLYPTFDGPDLKFARRRNAESIEFDAVIVDECSMIGKDLFDLIKLHLRGKFVLFVGDPAQLPPINEQESATFSTEVRSNLAEIIRQSADNPIIKTATTIRESQGTGLLDLSWVKPNKLPPMGVFIPADARSWMKKAFTSLDFDQDPDSFRYLCWTNSRVNEINAIIRQWRYGDNIPTPFVPGEQILFRQPVYDDEAIDPITEKPTKEILLHTNEEAELLDIREDVLSDSYNNIPFSIPTWRMKVQRDDGKIIVVHLDRVRKDYLKAAKAIRAAAPKIPEGWKYYHQFKTSFVKVQSVYAMTVHCSQGSTFGSVFLDLGDIMRRANSNLLECQQMLYVAATRPSRTLMVVNT